MPGMVQCHCLRLHLGSDPVKVLGVLKGRGGAMVSQGDALLKHTPKK